MNIIRLDEIRKNAIDLESLYLSELNKIIESYGSVDGLSMFLYGNKNTLRSKLIRTKKASPYKLNNYLEILERYFELSKDS